jgi:hypothetical protein
MTSQEQSHVNAFEGFVSLGTITPRPSLRSAARRCSSGMDCGDRTEVELWKERGVTKARSPHPAARNRWGGALRSITSTRLSFKFGPIPQLGPAVADVKVKAN